jgi:hypothetical protein
MYISQFALGFMLGFVIGVAVIIVLAYHIGGKK